MSDVSITVDTRGFERQLVAYKNATGKSWPQLLRQQGRLLAVNLAHQTQPFGSGQGAKEMGVRAVRRDIGKVYATPGEAYEEMSKTDERQAKGFWKLYKAGKHSKASGVVRRSSLSFTPYKKFDAQEHQNRRSRSSGKVLAGAASQVVQNPSKLKQYMRQKEKLVGMAKSGWKDCAKILGGVRGIPGWIKAKQMGRVRDQSKSKNNPTIYLNNTVRYLWRVLSRSQMNEAYRMQEEKMAEHVRITLEKHARKFK